MIEDIKNVIGDICNSIANGDSSKLKEVIEDFGTYCFKEDTAGQKFNDDIFNLILEMMGKPEFLNMEGADNLLMLFEFDWAMLTHFQKEKLSNAIEHSYDKYKYWMSCFVLSKLLGEYYCSESAFQVLCRLASSSKEIPRSLIPMAFEYLARGSSDSALKDKSITELKKMADDPSKQVQKEAVDSLNRLTIKR
jgi:hypothetical protein